MGAAEAETETKASRTGKQRRKSETLSSGIDERKLDNIVPTNEQMVRLFEVTSEAKKKPLLK
jgi:hypothetical protein